MLEAVAKAYANGKFYGYVLVDDRTKYRYVATKEELVKSYFDIKNMKIYPSGRVQGINETDSVMFEIAQQDELLGRITTIETGIITYKEHTELLGDINYINAEEFLKGLGE